MMYYEFTAGSEEYKLRLGTRNSVSLEQKLGCNPLMIFGDGSTVPTIEQMVQILHAALQKYHHNVNLEKAYDIFDAYIEDGHTITDFIYEIVEIYKVSGLIANDAETEAEKN